MHDDKDLQAGYPGVPLTIEGASILHQMFRLRRSGWNALTPDRRDQVVEEAVETMTMMEQSESGQTAFYTVPGHKADILAIHFRKNFEELNHAEMVLANLSLADFLEPVSSYLSVVELGLYESTVKLQSALAERKVEFGSPEWDQAVEEVLANQRRAMAPRLWPEIPKNKYLCFYPMDKKRGETKNWYSLPIRERQRMMNDHGLIGRRYAGKVKQIISGSIGFDDWEWGVDLFADDPLIFKQLIYEMRFDEASADYALFGPFYIGLRFPVEQMGRLLQGRDFRP
jgi:peroxiredoxin